MVRLSSNWKSKLPFNIKKISKNNDNILLIDDDNVEYYLLILDKIKYLSFMEISKSKKIKKPIFEFRDNGYFCLIYKISINQNEEKSVLKKIINCLIYIFDEFSYSINLKKEFSRNLSNIYKVLDNKFTYLEMRIREYETAPVKNDITWMILSKYYNILDAKMYLYDLQQDMFNIIDKNESISIGLVFKSIKDLNYKNGLIEPLFDMYYSPKGMLVSRYYVHFDNYEIDDILSEIIEKLSEFDKKYFAFMTLYIYILNINLELFLDYNNISSYLLVCARINNFIKRYGSLAK